MDDQNNPKSRSTEPVSTPAKTEPQIRPAVPRNTNASGAEQLATSRTPEQSQKKKRKILTIVLSIVVGLLVIGGVALAIWYFMWQSSDRKIGHDAIEKVRTAEAVAVKGDINFVAKSSSSLPEGMKLSINFDAESTKSTAALNVVGQYDSGSGDSITVKGSVIAANDTLYLKIDNLSEITDVALGDDSTPEAQEFFERYSDRWIKISTSDLEGITSESGTDATTTCLTDALYNFANNKDQVHEFYDIVMDSGVISAERVGKEDVAGSPAYRYDITFDSDKVKSENLAGAMKETAFYQSLMKCSNDLTDLTEVSSGDISTSMDDMPQPKLSIWVNTKTHEPVRVLFEMSDDEAALTADFEFAFDIDGKVNIPADSVTIQELVTELYGGSIAPTNLQLN